LVSANERLRETNERRRPRGLADRSIISEFPQAEPVVAPRHQATAIPFVP